MKDFNSLPNKINSNSIHKSMYIISKIPLPAEIMRTNYETIMGSIRVEKHISIDPDDKVIFQAVFPHKLWQTLSKNVQLLIHIIVSAARH